MAAIIVPVVLFIAGCIAVYLAVVGGSIWMARRATRGSANRAVRAAVPVLAVVVAVLLPWSQGLYMETLCTVAGGLDIARPVADIEGLVIDPDRGADCDATCYTVLHKGYAFVEFEVRPDAGIDYGARYFRFFFGDAASGECMDTPDAHGRCLLRQRVRTLSAPYLLTRSDFMRPVGLDIRRLRFKLIDRRTGDTLGSMTWYQQGSTGLMYIFNSFVGFPLTCPVGNQPEENLVPLLKRFPPAPHKQASVAPLATPARPAFPATSR